MRKFTLILQGFLLLIGLFIGLSVQSQSECLPLNQSSYDITIHSASLSWDGLSGDTWVRFHRVGEQNNHYHYKFANTNDTVQINNLIDSAQYTWELNTLCNGVWSGYGWLQSFNTPEDTIGCVPTNQLADEITAHSAKLSWQNLAGSTEIRYFPTGTIDYLYKNAHHNQQATLHNLLDSTEYTWELRTICQGEWTEFGWSSTFSTFVDTVVCEPTNQQANDITAHSVSLLWEGLTTPTWVRYYDSGEQNPHYRYRFAATTNTVSMIHLLDSTTYIWELNTFCNGGWTGYGWAHSFTTLVDTVVCEPSNMQSFNITGNSADLSWEGLNNPTWVRYKQTGDDHQHFHYAYADTNAVVSISNLHGNSEYTWEINTLCNGFWTGYEWAAIFTTIEDTTTYNCEPADQLADSITDHSVRLSWTGLNNFTWVKYQCEESNHPRYKYAGLDSTIVIHHLHDSSNYFWELNTWCDGQWTGYHWESSFTTIPDTTQTTHYSATEGSSMKQIAVNENIIGLNLYPNPVNDEVSITYIAMENSQCNIRIINVLGKLVYQNQGISTEGENIIEFSLADLKSGLYTVLIETGGTVNQLKLIKK